VCAPQVKCLDSFTGQQTRLVVIVDGLDSCEQDKVLLVLDAVHMLFSDTTSPFIVILAIDPHIISKVRYTCSPCLSLLKHWVFERMIELGGFVWSNGALLLDACSMLMAVLNNHFSNIQN
jgi:KAP family P-loop domain